MAEMSQTLPDTRTFALSYIQMLASQALPDRGLLARAGEASCPGLTSSHRQKHAVSRISSLFRCLREFVTPGTDCGLLRRHVELTDSLHVTLDVF